MKKATVAKKCRHLQISDTNSKSVVAVSLKGQSHNIFTPFRPHEQQFKIFDFGFGFRGII